MAQIFNNAGQPHPVQPPHSSPPNGMTEQIYRRKPKSRFHPKIFAVIAGMLVVLGLPITVFISQQQQRTQQQASGVTPPIAVCSKSILLDTKSFTTGVNTKQITWQHTTGTNANTILIVGVGADNGTRNTVTNPDPVTSISYNGIALKKILEKDCNVTRCSNDVWYMMNPPAGQHNIVVNLSAAGSVNAGAATFYNVNIATPFANPVSNVNNGNPTVTVPNTIASQVIVDIATLDDDATKLTSSNNGVNLWSSRDTAQLTINGGQYTQAKNGSTTVGWISTAPYPEEYADIAVPLNGATNLCITPTVVASPTSSPTPTTTPTPTPTIQPSITPTACITPGQVQNVKVTCANCASSQ